MILNAEYTCFLSRIFGDNYFLGRKLIYLALILIPIFYYCNLSFGAEVCGICFENIDVSDQEALFCGHLFHQSCLKKWLNKPDYSQCPQCYTKILINPYDKRDYTYHLDRVNRELATRFSGLDDRELELILLQAAKITLCVSAAATLILFLYGVCIWSISGV